MALTKKEKLIICSALSVLIGELNREGLTRRDPKIIEKIKPTAKLLRKFEKELDPS